jgi:hypothetical protein
LSVLLLLSIVLSDPSSFVLCIVCSFFFCSLFCLSFFTMDKRRRTSQYNG